eukprot:jgi/Bigna1/75981/fgenesh1_pg.38_\
MPPPSTGRWLGALVAFSLAVICSSSATVARNSHARIRRPLRRSLQFSGGGQLRCIERLRNNLDYSSALSVSTSAQRPVLANAAADKDNQLNAANELLEWISQEYGEGGGHPAKVEAKDSHEGSPRGLYAKQSFKEGEVILRVPLRLAIFESESPGIVEGLGSLPSDKIEGGFDNAKGYPRKTDDPMSPENFWTGKLAMQMLNNMYTTESETSESPHWKMWLNSLPEKVDLPANGFNEDDVYFTENYEFIQENSFLRRVNHRICEALLFPNPKHTTQEAVKLLQNKEDAEQFGAIKGEEAHRRGGFPWALNIASSRALTGSYAGHYLVPGVDLCNHDYGVAATARLESEAGDPVLNPRFGTVRLIADRDIEAGEEIKFTYARVPNEVLYAYYGFVPESNPYDDVVLFDDLQVREYDIRWFHKNSLLVLDTLILFLYFRDYLHFPFSKDVFKCAIGSNEIVAEEVLEGAVADFMDAVNDPNLSTRDYSDDWGDGCHDGYDNITVDNDEEKVVDGSGKRTLLRTEDDFKRLTINFEGIDGRLVTVLDAVSQMVQLGKSVPEFLVDRIKKKCATFSTTLGEDEYELSSTPEGSSKQYSLRLRISKKKICQGAINAFESMAGKSAPAAPETASSMSAAGEDSPDVLLD